MPRPHALTWVACFLYASVLIAGLAVASTAPVDPVRSIAFAGTLLVAGALEIVERRGPSSRVAALAGLVVRAAVYTVITALDSSGNAKVLFVLLPLTAYFTAGHRVAYALAGGGLLFACVLVIGRPALRDDPEALSDLLMFAIGVVFALAIAVIAEREQTGRRRAETLLTELSDTHARLREYADQAATLATVAERSRLARDIHDSVGHHLTAVSIQLEKAEAFRQRDGAVADQAVADARSAATRALQEVRESVGALRAEPFSLVSAIVALADGLDDHGFRVAVESTGSEAGHARAGLEALYRVAQEALTNARRHAGADLVRVVVRLDDPGPAMVEVADNGRGFAVATATGGGLRGMRERLAALGGVVRIESTPGQGTRVTASVGAA